MAAVNGAKPTSRREFPSPVFGGRGKALSALPFASVDVSFDTLLTRYGFHAKVKETMETEVVSSVKGEQHNG
ncbi:hypothetical protein [Desulfobaculum senezii]